MSRSFEDDWNAAAKAAREAYETLKGPLPEGLTGQQAVDRRTNASHQQHDAMRALGTFADDGAVEALIDLLLLAKRDDDLGRFAVKALRKSPGQGIAARVAARALEPGIDVLVVHRDPSVISALEEMIARDGAHTPRHWCVGICIAASYGHQPSCERLEELFGNPVGLDSVGYLGPMLAGLVNGEAADVWEMSAPLRAILFATPPPMGRFGPLGSTLIACVGRARQIDPRWQAQALETLEHANSDVAARAIPLLERLAQKDHALRDRLFERGDAVHVHILAKVGDMRARAPLEETLRTGGWNVIWAADLLHMLPERDDDLIEKALATVLGDRNDDGLLAGAGTVIEAFEKHGSMRSEEHFATALANLSSASLQMEDWADSDAEARTRRKLIQRLEAVRPATSPQSWSSTLAIRNVDTDERLEQVDEAGLRGFVETPGTYQIALDDGELTVHIGKTHGWLLWDRGDDADDWRNGWRMCCSISPEPPRDDLEIPHFGDPMEVSASQCVAKQPLLQLVVAGCHENSIGAIQIEWEDIEAEI